MLVTVYVHNVFLSLSGVCFVGVLRFLTAGGTQAPRLPVPGAGLNCLAGYSGGGDGDAGPVPCLVPSRLFVVLPSTAAPAPGLSDTRVGADPQVRAQSCEAASSHVPQVRVFLRPPPQVQRLLEQLAGLGEALGLLLPVCYRGHQPGAAGWRRRGWAPVPCHAPTSPEVLPAPGLRVHGGTGIDWVRDWWRHLPAAGGELRALAPLPGGWGLGLLTGV